MSETPKVLIVDDEDRFRSTMIRRLKGEGITASGVGTGEAALKSYPAPNMTLCCWMSKCRGLTELKP